MQSCRPLTSFYCNGRTFVIPRIISVVIAHVLRFCKRCAAGDPSPPSLTLTFRRIIAVADREKYQNLWCKKCSYFRRFRKICRNSEKILDAASSAKKIDFLLFSGILKRNIPTILTFSILDFGGGKVEMGLFYRFRSP